jgi:hypothetical protein
MTSYKELIDYDAQFAELAKRGILFSEEDKVRFKSICNEELDRWTDPVLGRSLGASATNWVYTLFSFIQSIFKGFDVNEIGNSLANATDDTGEKLKIHMLQQATMRIYNRFKSEGGQFALAAELVSGQKLIKPGDDAAPERMETGIYNQAIVKAHLNDQPSRLNRGRGES